MAWSWLRPSTLPSNEPVAIHDSSRGIVIEKLGSGSCAENPPIWKTEKPHGWQVFHCASEAAIFIPCALVTASPKRLPTDSWMSVAGTATISASFAARWNSSTLRPRRKCQHETPSMTDEPKISAGQDRVQPRGQGEVVRQQRAHARELRLAVDDLVADRVLHPRVGHQDEVRRQPRAQRRDPDRREVQPRGKLVPAEDPQPEERRLEHERGQALDRQRGAEHAADEVRVHRPVHPELELLDQARSPPRSRS